MIGNSKNIDIRNEQNRIIDKINTIKQSDIFSQLTTSLNYFKDNSLDPFQVKNINIYGRLKKASSATAKIAQKNISSDEIYDLIAFMFVVDLPENYEYLKNTLTSTLHGVTYSHLFDGTLPENNGYSSLHLGIDVNTFLGGHNAYPELEGLSAEIQLKTYGMYMAQEATHDSIYKNDSLSRQQKFDMQSLMFPLIEHLTDIEMYERALNVTVNEDERKAIEEKILALRQRIKEHKENNIDYINENMSLIDSVFKEYVARKNIEKLKMSIPSELSSEQIEGLISTYRNAISYLSNSQEPDVLSDTDPTGFKNIDELLDQVESKGFNEIVTLGQRYESQNKSATIESVINLSKKSVTLNNLSSELSDLQNHMISTSEKDESDKNR